MWAILDEHIAQELHSTSLAIGRTPSGGETGPVPLCDGETISFPAAVWS